MKNKYYLNLEEALIYWLLCMTNRNFMHNWQPIRFKNMTLPIYHRVNLLKTRKEFAFLTFLEWTFEVNTLGERSEITSVWNDNYPTSSAGHTARNEYARSQVEIWNLRRRLCDEGLRSCKACWITCRLLGFWCRLLGWVKFLQKYGTSSANL
jgi:hypothetical protein